MRIIKYLVFLPILLLLSGCCAFVSNEDIESFWNSDKERMEEYKDHLNREVGEPLYGIKTELCDYKYQCTYIDKVLIEYIPISIAKDSCVIAWIINEETMGKYAHPNGLLLDIVGQKKSWRYVSDPEKCLFTMNHCGPW